MVSCTHGHCRKAVESKHDGHTTDILNDSGVPKPPLATSEGNTGLGNAKPSGANRRVWVYKYDGSLQCNMGQALSLNAMAQQLAGIKVYSQMKKNDGKARGAVCDSPTGIANLYEIDVEALSKAEAKEFKEWKF